MTRLGFQWTEWSTPPITATIVVTCWALAFAAFAGVASLLGFADAARAALVLTQAFLAGGGVLLLVALLAGSGLARRDAPGARPVERTVHR